MTRRGFAVTTTILWLLIGLYAIGFGLLAAHAYDAHETGGAFDLGNYVQALWNAARGHGLALTTVPEFGPTRFAMHVEPILFLLAPILRFITDDPRFLLWFQAAVIALGGLPLYGLARRRIGSDWGALGMVLVYFLLPALESVTLFDFHAVGLAPTLLLSALYFLDQALISPDDRRGIWYGCDLSPQPLSLRGKGERRSAVCLAMVFFLLALGTKEDISLHVFLFGLYLMFLRRRWRPGLALSVVGLAWFYVAVFVVIRAARPDGSQSAYLGFFSQLGSSPQEILLSPFRSPDKVLSLLATPDVLRGIAMLTLPLALTPFVGLPLFVLAAPTLAIALLSSNPMMHKLETYHYAAPAIPFVMLAAVDGAARLSIWLQRAIPRVPRLRIEIAMVGLVVLASFVYHYYRGYSPLARPYHWPEATDHDRLGDALAASIPPQAPVVAQAELVPLVARRPYVRVWTGPFDERAEYYLLDVSHPAFTNRNGAQERLVADIAYEPSVGMIASQDGYIVLRQGAPRVPVTPEFFSFLFAPPPAEARPVNATFGGQLQLVAYETSRLATDREAEPLVALYWHVLKDLRQDYFVSIFLLDERDTAVGATLYQQPTTVWWPTSRWKAGDNIRMLANTFPWWTGDRRIFSYGVAVMQGTDPWNVAARLPVMRSDSGPAPTDESTVLPLVRFRRIADIPYAE